ncbi:MAG: VOC family protein [Cytophagales bacterium]|nr:VOC family protein [Cytophagales bacterium]
MNLKVAIICGVLLAAGCTPGPKQAISPRFNHVMLYVSNLEKSIDFYTRAFDLQVTNRLDTLVATQPDGNKLVRLVNMAFLKFKNQDFVLELSQNSVDTTNPTAFLFQHLGVDVQDIDAAYQRALDAGAAVMVPVRVVKAKGIEAKQAFVGGPDGERVELMQIVAGEF